MLREEKVPHFEKDVWNEVYAFLRYGVMPAHKTTASQVKNFKQRCRRNYIVTEDGLYFRKKDSEGR